MAQPLDPRRPGTPEHRNAEGVLRRSPESSPGYRIADFEFDPASGELTSEGQTTRLAPQPARLLELLARRAGEVVDRREIREALWPGIATDIDANLHFCVRQLRAGLGDSASRPRFVETLPRRGYRLLVPVEVLSAATPNAYPASDAASTTSQEATFPAGGLRGRRALLTGLGIAALAISLWVAIAGIAHRGSPPAGRLRVAIMSFAAPEGVVISGDPARASEELLYALASVTGPDGEPVLDVLGPRTTAAYSTDLRALPAMAEKLRLDYILNGRYLVEEGAAELFVELIRASDGAHVRVLRFDEPGKWREVSEAVRASVEEPLGLAP